MTKKHAQFVARLQRSMVTVERMASHSVNFAGMNMLINATDAQKNAKSKRKWQNGQFSITSPNTRKLTSPKRESKFKWGCFLLLPLAFEN